MTVKFVHLCPSVDIDQDLFENDRSAAERDRERRYEDEVTKIGQELKRLGIRHWIPGHKGFVKVDLVARQQAVEEELSLALHGASGWEMALVSLEDHESSIRMRVEQDPFGSSVVEALISKERSARDQVQWFGALMPDEPLGVLSNCPTDVLADLVEIAAERCSEGSLRDLVLPWDLPTPYRSMVVAKDEFAQTALAGGRFLVVASYSGAELRPVETGKETVGESQKIPGFVKFLASRAALISGTKEGRVAIQSRRIGVRENGTVGQIDDGRLWAGPVDSPKMPERFRSAARAAVKAAACMPTEAGQVRWGEVPPRREPIGDRPAPPDSHQENRAFDAKSGRELPCEVVTREELVEEERKAAPAQEAKPSMKEPARLGLDAWAPRKG